MIKKMTVMMVMVMLLAGFSFSQAEKEEEIKLDAKACIQKCLEFIKAADGDNAIKYAKKAVELDTNNSNYQFQLGVAYQVKLNHKDTNMMAKLPLSTSMLDAWKKAVELDKTNVQARQGLIGFYLNAPPIAGGSVSLAEEQAIELIKYDESLGNTAYAGILLKKQDFDKAKDLVFKAYAAHMELKKKSPEKKSSFGEALLNSLGYGLLGAGKKEEAIEAFKMNVKAYPESFNTYDSLAETYMNMGETKLAIENYEMALKLNPNNTNFYQKLYHDEKTNLEKLKAATK